jgi:hypothetical protein
MSTNSSIAWQRPDGKYEAIYCHWDGYIRGVGKCLLENYNESNLPTLMALGDLSVLGAEPIDYPAGRDPGVSVPDNRCLSYAARGDYTPSAVYDSKVQYADYICLEYNYLFENGTWFVWKNSVNTATPLASHIPVE